MSKSIESKFTRRRLQLIACLIPILIAWYYLLAEFPITFFQGTISYFASPERRTLTIINTSHAGDWDQYLVFDAHSGRIRVEKNATLARNSLSWPEFVTSVSKDGSAIKKWRLWTFAITFATAFVATFVLSKAFRQRKYQI